jgi:hypothetical protein
MSLHPAEAGLMIHAATCSKCSPILNHLTRSAVGAIFFRQDTVLSPALPNSGNYHVFYRLPVTTSTVAKTNTIVCLLGGSNICALKLSGYSSCLKKNTPTPELDNAQQR